MKKIIRITTVPASLRGLLKGQLKFMADYFEIVGISSNLDGLLVEMGKKEGVRTITVEMTRKITPFRDIVSLYKLYKIFKKEKPDIVHTHTPKAGTLGMIAAKLAKIPNRMHTIAELPLVEATGFKRRVLNAVETLTYSCATKIYPNSYGLKTIILNNKFTTENKLKVIGNGSSNGINTNHFNPDLFTDKELSSLKEKLKIKEDDFVFVFIGRIVKDKGINELIESFVTFEKQNKKAKLLLVGVFEAHLDPLEETTIDIIKENNNIIHAGWQDDVRPFFAISNALVFPSYREGFPNVVLQAGAMKLPCIVSDINGCNEIVTDKINGLIVPVKDSEKLLNAMLEITKHNVDELNQMGEKSRQLIISKYDQQFVWQALLEEYNNTLEKSRNNQHTNV
ncbi:MAG: glycosyltransferase family 4 protein [Aestuariibaculum sp.]